MKFIGIIFIIMVTQLLFTQYASGQYTIAQSVFGNGAGIITNGSNHIISTTGQPFIGITSNTVHKHIAGFWYVQGAKATGISTMPEEILPGAYQLMQNYPNPFNPATVIEYALPEVSHVTIKVYNVLGEEIDNLFDGLKIPGVHRVEWKPVGIASGLYFYRIVATAETGSRSFSDVKRLMFIQ